MPNKKPAILAPAFGKDCPLEATPDMRNTIKQLSQGTETMKSAPITTINGENVANVHMIDFPVAIVEYHNGNMVIADVEDLEDHGQAFTIGLPFKKFPAKMSHADRVAAMRASYRNGW